jgi:hypothetical protein
MQKCRSALAKFGGFWKLFEIASLCFRALVDCAPNTLRVFGGCWIVSQLFLQGGRPMLAGICFVLWSGIVSCSMNRGAHDSSQPIRVHVPSNGK